MNDQKILDEIVKWLGFDKSHSVIESMAYDKAIIARYPQVLAEKCYEGEAIQLGLTSAYKDTVTQSALWGSTELTKIKVYIEVQS